MGYGIFQVIETSPIICHIPYPMTPSTIVLNTLVEQFVSLWVELIQCIRDGGWEKIPKEDLPAPSSVSAAFPASWLLLEYEDGCLAGCPSPHGIQNIQVFDQLNHRWSKWCITHVIHHRWLASVTHVDWWMRGLPQCIWCIGFILVQTPSTDHDSYRHTRRMDVNRMWIASITSRFCMDVTLDVNFQGPPALI